MADVLIPLADGVEEMEAVIIIDVLRRAGWTVTAAAVGDRVEVRGSRGVRLIADGLWSDDRPGATALLIPGGMRGTEALMRHEGVLDAVRAAAARTAWLGAICAGPLVLQAAGVLTGIRATCHPDVRARLTSALFTAEPVVVDGRVITSQGPGTAIAFALRTIAEIDGPQAAAAVRKGLVLSDD